MYMYQRGEATGYCTYCPAGAQVAPKRFPTMALVAKPSTIVGY